MLAAGVHCDIHDRYISVGEPQVTPSQLSEQGDAGVHRVEPFRHRRPGTLIRQLAKSRNR